MGHCAVHQNLKQETLTLMSILVDIQYRVTEGRLTKLSPLMSNARIRSIYLSSDVKSFFEGPWSSNKEAIRAGRARAILEDFVTGAEIVGRLPPSKSVHTVIALLEPASEEVWEFRIGDPKPGVRIFGRFADKDIFIGTSWSYRESFNTEKDWRDFGFERCKTDWRNLFPAYSPHSGTSIHDYISNSRLPP